MTPERKAAEEFNEELLHTMSDVHQLVADIVTQAAACGIVVTIRTVPKLPLAMGNYSLDVDTRPSRKTYQEYERLLRAAEDSEKEQPDGP